MDDTLLAVGRWTDDRVHNQMATMRPYKKESEGLYRYLSTESHSRASRPNRNDRLGSIRPNYHHRLSRPEDELLDRPPKAAIKEVRATQMIQRQHPACFVKAEGGQQGNEATAKPSGSLSRVERHFLKQASAYLPLDEQEVKSRQVYWTG
ncbi:hypothetical protein HD806DRAFT_478219 [Xylariaceae sp. AK1471]|nr:hypothetical protein HD806DRAFT_478219 [Xylariaceae sp. AK1471]